MCSSDLLVSDIARQHGAERSADTGCGADNALREAEMAAAESDIGDNERDHHAEDGRGDAIEHLHRDQQIWIAYGGKQHAADRQRGKTQQQQWPTAWSSVASACR